MRRTKEEALQTRETLLDSALSVFLSKGYSNSTLQDIAEKAKVTRGAVYWHFKGKEEVFMALYRREHIFINQLFVDVLSTELDPIIKLRSAVEAIIKNLYENERFAKYIELSRFKIESAFLESLLHGNQGTYNFVIEEFEKIAHEAIQNGSIESGLSATDISRTLYTLIIGIYRLKFSAAQDFADQKASLSIIESYFNSIRQRKDND